ncbi:hypothetical protein VTN96DRAFT_4833 [Rasamsonia emersonii]
MSYSEHGGPSDGGLRHGRGTNQSKPVLLSTEQPWKLPPNVLEVGHCSRQPKASKREHPSGSRRKSPPGCHAGAEPSLAATGAVDGPLRGRRHGISRNRKARRPHATGSSAGETSSRSAERHFAQENCFVLPSLPPRSAPSA